MKSQYSGLLAGSPTCPYNRITVAIEIEKKYLLDKKRLVELATKLADLGAEFSYETFEENYLHRGGVLDERDAVLRLRKSDIKTTLTYKEKRGVVDDFKQQIEFETEVKEVEATENIIERLGYKLAIVYEKHRKAWRFNDVEIVLDELPFGYYMEIEGEKAAILDAEKLLGVEDLNTEPRGYPRLTAKFGKLLKNGVYEARFEKMTTAS
jgi:adenylate cyclase class 2